MEIGRDKIEFGNNQWVLFSGSGEPNVCYKVPQWANGQIKTCSDACPMFQKVNFDDVNKRVDVFLYCGSHEVHYNCDVVEPIKEDNDFSLNEEDGLIPNRDL